MVPRLWASGWAVSSPERKKQRPKAAARRLVAAVEDPPRRPINVLLLDACFVYVSLLVFVSVRDGFSDVIGR